MRGTLKRRCQTKVKSRGEEITKNTIERSCASRGGKLEENRTQVLKTKKAKAHPRAPARQGFQEYLKNEETSRRSSRRRRRRKTTM